MGVRDKARRWAEYAWVTRVLPMQVRMQSNRQSLETVAGGLVDVFGRDVSPVQRLGGMLKIGAGIAQTSALTYGDVRTAVRRIYNLEPFPWPAVQAWVFSRMVGMRPVRGQIPGMSTQYQGRAAREDAESRTLAGGLYDNGVGLYAGTAYLWDRARAQKWVQDLIGLAPEHNAVEVLTDDGGKIQAPEMYQDEALLQHMTGGGIAAISPLHLRDTGRLELSCSPSMSEVRQAMLRRHGDDRLLPVLLYGPSGSGKTLTAVCAVGGYAGVKRTLILPGATVRGLSSRAEANGTAEALRSLLDLFGCSALVLDDYLHTTDSLSAVEALGRIGVPVVLTVMDPDLPSLPGLRPGRISAALRFRPVTAEADAEALAGGAWKTYPELVRAALLQLEMTPAFIDHVVTCVAQDADPRPPSERGSVYWWRLLQDTADTYTMGADSSLRVYAKGRVQSRLAEAASRTGTPVRALAQQAGYVPTGSATPRAGGRGGLQAGPGPREASEGTVPPEDMKELSPDAVARVAFLQHQLVQYGDDAPPELMAELEALDAEMGAWPDAPHFVPVAPRAQTTEVLRGDNCEAVTKRARLRSARRVGGPEEMTLRAMRQSRMWVHHAEQDPVPENLSLDDMPDYVPTIGEGSEVGDHQPHEWAGMDVRYGRGARGPSSAIFPLAGTAAAHVEHDPVGEMRAALDGTLVSTKDEAPILTPGASQREVRMEETGLGLIREPDE